MKNLYTSISLSFLMIMLTSDIFSQSSKHNFSVYLGYGVSTPDKRIISSSIQEYTMDDEYSVGIIYKYSLFNRVSIGVGMGYAQVVQDFPIRANGHSYFRALIDPVFWRDKSQYHMVQILPSIDINLIKSKTVLGINVLGMSNISFRKHIDRFNLSRNNIEYFASEMYTGAFAEYKKFRLDVGYRVLNLKYRDDAIENNGLETDPYNPFKLRFQLSYMF